MKKLSFILFILIAITSCKSLTTVSTEESTNQILFKASGNEPFWNIQMNNENIIFSSLNEGYEKILFSYVESSKTLDSNVKSYQLNSIYTTGILQIYKKNCVNSMSGEISDYVVNIEIKKPNSNKISFEGCGKFITDYRLNDIWVLEQLKGKVVTTDDFARELPNMEIDADKNTFMGYAGCNRMAGKIVSENELLRFTNVLSTEIACIDRNREIEFLQALQSVKTFKIENNRLLLSNNFGTQLVFKKVD